MSEGFREYKRHKQKRTPDKKVHSSIFKKFIRQSVYSLLIFIAVFGLKLADPQKTNIINSFVQNAFTQPFNAAQIGSAITDFFNQDKKTPVKEGSANETTEKKSENVE